uniref:MurNAc-LAA domain-containing protein n=1 Tax=Knufia peltigerae TaxID=1002370 RepID=A0AA38XT21_9EURO|nr:hypothetical protein H2204_012116 [Knufia peltigerae]
MKRRSIIPTAVLGLLLAASSSCPAASVEVVPPEQATDVALDLMLTREGQRMLDRFQLARSKSANLAVTASVDLVRQVLVIDLDRRILDGEDDHSFEDIEQRIRTALAAYALQAGAGEVVTEIVYGGKPYSHYFQRDLQFRQGVAPLGNSVLVSASHGLVSIHPGREWEFQRPLSHGIREDLITPGYAEELQTFLQDRGSASVYRARRNTGDLHPDSMRPWSEMSARYHLMNLLPDRTDIWHHFANSTERDREVKDDIRSRPYYANHLAVEGMLSLHTNASDSPSARGTRAYYHANKQADRELGDMALCYMHELITAQDAYTEFPVAAKSEAARHGENGFAHMPSVVIEIAFHTNAEDAAAFLDPVFRTASMKGVEKGYRLFREGKGCVPLKAEPIQGIQLPQGSSQQVDVAFEGYPQYPIELVTTNVGCPPGWTCSDGKVHITTPDDKPSQITLRCENAGSAPILWDTRVVDADGVKSPSVRHVVQCIRTSRGSNGAPISPAGVEPATAG